MDEVQWCDHLNHHKQISHFRSLVTHFIDMPISSISDALSHVLFNPKYAGQLWKLTIAVDHVENIVWIGLALHHIL